MKFSVLLGIGALVGLGVYAGKKLSEYKEECGVVYTEEKETIGDKFHNASMFAVGTVRTGVEKLAEGLKEAKSTDILKKGEDTVDGIKNSAESIINDVLDLKDMILSRKSADYTYDEYADIFEENEQVEDLNAEFGIGEPDESAEASVKSAESETKSEQTVSGGGIEDLEEI